MKKYRIYIIFAFIILLLVLFRQPIGNIIRYQSGDLDGVIGMAPDGFTRIVHSTSDGERELDQIELQKFIRMFKTMKVRTNIWKSIEFPDDEYIIYSKYTTDNPIFRVRLTGEAIELLKNNYHLPDSLHIFLIDN